MSSVVDWAAARSDKWRRHLAGLEVMLAPIDAPLIHALELSGPMRIADVGCGSGATTLAVAHAAPLGSQVHGFDLSPALIEVARRREVGDRDVRFTLADMGIAAPPERRFDRLVSRFGVMFFQEPHEAFANLHRWLVPGGRFAFAVWGPVDDNTWFTLVRDVVARTITLKTPDPEGPGPFRYASVEPLVALLLKAGCVDIAVEEWRGLLPMGDRPRAADAAAFALGAFSSFEEQLGSAGGDAMTRAHHELTRHYADLETTGPISLPARVHIVTGRTVEIGNSPSGQGAHRHE